MTDLFAVVGKPVVHSRSPDIHNAAFHTLGIDAVYTRMAAESVREALQTSEEIGMAGLNVTAPFKKEMARRMDRLDAGAKKLGAVNTVLFRQGKRHGYNTDPDGVLGALLTQGINPRKKKVVLLGAGGAARAAACMLTKKGANVTILNRTAEKAGAVAKLFHCSYAALDNAALCSILSDSDILISTLGTLEPVIPAGCIQKNTVVLDANYSGESALVKEARKRGCRIIDGREWLLYQGAKAFEIFTGRKAPVAVMRKALYAEPTTHYPQPKTHDSRPKTQNIALIGFMGSGKSTVGKILAQKTRGRLFDIDAHVERAEGISIQEIFEDNGEAHFRKLERKTLRQALQQQNSIVACGGGVVLDRSNRSVLHTHATVVWLWAKPRTVFRRIAHDLSRPLLDVKNREQVAHRIIQHRLPMYAETADMVIDTEKRTPARVARLIAEELKTVAL